MEYLSTLLIALGLTIIVVLIIRHLVRARRRGENSCGCGCSSCASSGICHGITKETFEKQKADGTLKL